jgi:DNA helicase-2/ATP-dependent DNA helicase PcrA
MVMNHPVPAGAEQGADSDTAPSMDGRVPQTLLAGLDPSQRRAVQALDGPVLVVAGPGSGKTRVLTHRIAALLGSGRCQPWEILAVTFTNKAAAEMRERTKALVGDVADRIWVSTFHATCARILRMSHDEAGLASNFTIFDADDAQRILRGVLVESGLPIESGSLRKVASLISTVRNSGEGAEALAGYGYPELVDVQRLYEKRLEELGGVDFDGLLTRTEHLLRTRTDVADRYRSRFRYVMVDEYQDTNMMQYRITQMLSALHGNICVVGDFDQSIYAWRGATPELMEGFTEDHPDATVVALDANYRSTPEIVSVCRSVIAPNPSVHRAAMRTENGSGLPVRLLTCADDRDEALTVVGELAGLPPGHTGAILLRTNAQSLAFEVELGKRHMSYGVVGALRFYDRAEVKDALSWLRVALNNRDHLSLARAASVPRRGLGQATLDLIVERSRRDGSSAVAAARALVGETSLPKRAHSSVEGFLNDLDRVDAAAHAGGPHAALRVVLEEVGVRNHHQGDSEESRGRLENLDALLDGARDLIEPDPYTATALFLESTALLSAADGNRAEDPSRQQVLIMTVHASKGKEFDQVYVCGVEDKLFPLSHGDEEPADLEEERRLFFVACSRARERLTVTHTRKRMRNGKITAATASVFVASLPDEVVRSMTPAAAGSQVHLPRHLTGGGNRPITRSAPKPPRRTPGPRLSASQAVAGSRVRHPSFGTGIVLALYDDTVQPTISVQFEAGIRTLALDVAPLELIGPDGTQI